MSEQDKPELPALRDQTDARQLRWEIYHLLGETFLLPGTVPAQLEDV
jgi:hypothetical protein